MEYDLVPSAEKQAFLAHIIDDPADDLRRLVFADWLEEHGQGQRAAYIRARCALDGKTPEFGGYADAVAQLWDYLFRGDEIIAIVGAKLVQRFPGIRFVSHDVFGNTHGSRQRELLALVPDKLRLHKVDAVISLVGA